MTTPTAIETEYAGHRFRSRLEARWAVFFDHLGIKWFYEPQGYELGNGRRYLPDFWLETFGVWAEVKGNFDAEAASVAIAAAEFDGLPIDYHRGRRPCDVADRRMLAMGESIRRVLLLGEIPPAHQDGWAHSLLTLAGGIVMDSPAVILGGRSDLDLMPVGPFGSPYGLDRRGVSGFPLHFIAPVGVVLDAYGTARKARFEHGESGAVKATIQQVVGRMAKR